MDLKIATTSHGGWHVMSVAGDLDLASSPILRDGVQRLGGSAIILDVSDVSFIDSSGLGAIVSSLGLIRERGGYARLVAPERSPVDRLIQLTGLGQLIGLSPSLDDLEPPP